MIRLIQFYVLTKKNIKKNFIYKYGEESKKSLWNDKKATTFGCGRLLAFHFSLSLTHLYPFHVVFC